MKLTVDSHGVAVIVGFRDDDVIDNDHYYCIAMRHLSVISSDFGEGEQF